MRDETIELLSSQNIYEKLLNDGKFSSMNPIDIISDINLYGTNLENESDDISAEELFENLSKNMGLPEEFNSNKIDTNDLDSILDQLLDKNDIDSIIFDADHQNIYELEITPDNKTIEKLDFDKVELSDEEIKEKLYCNIKLIGSNLQRTIKVYDLYSVKDLLFQDESIDLSEMIINKLFSFWEIIIDFSNINNVSDSFLRGTFNNICKFFTPNELKEKIDIINLDDEDVIKIYNTIIPNAYKFWINENIIDKIDYDKLDLIRLLDPNSELLLNNPSIVNTRVLPFERIQIKKLGSKREKKLRYPIWFVERVTEELLINYNIDEKINNFLESQLYIDTEIAKFNIFNKDLSKHKYQIPEDLFEDLVHFTEAIILDASTNYLNELKNQIFEARKNIEKIKTKIPKVFLDAGGMCFQNLYLDDKLMKEVPNKIKNLLRSLEEFEFELLDLEHKYIIKEDILRNIFEYIPFGGYNDSLDKINLVAYHYLCKYLEKIALEIKTDKDIPYKIRGFVNSLEIFRYDLLKILCENTNMKKFIFTLKEYVMKWVVKYTSGSRLAQLYFDILMVTPDILTEDILRMICLNIIKNKNPITLRAIFSAYVSMIHLIIDSNLNSSLLNFKKYGNFSSMLKLDDAQKHDRFLVPNKLGALNYPEKLLLNILVYKHPKNWNENHYLIKRLNLSKFLEYNSLRVFSTKPKDIGMYDWFWYYKNFVNYFEKDSESVYKIKNKFLKSDKRNAQLKYIEILCHDILYDVLKPKIIDNDCIVEILGVIAEDISMRTINNGYLDKNFNLIVKSNADYLNYIHNALIDIKNNI